MTRSFSFRLAAIFLILTLQACYRMRWQDGKALRVFKHQHAPLAVYDTLIGSRHIHYAISSDSDTLPYLVFIHGSPGSWFHYKRYMLDTALRQKFQIVAFDRPGFGHSNFGSALHLADQARLITPVLQNLSKKAMFLCGHSMGGPLAIKLAADNPDLFETVIIVAGAIDPGQEKKERWRQVMGNKGMRWLLPGAFRPSNTELLYLKKDLIPLKDDFNKITSDVIFVHGDRDTWVPIENVRFGQTMLRNANSIHSDTLKGADHQIPWKNYTALKNILLNLK